MTYTRTEAEVLTARWHYTRFLKNQQDSVSENVEYRDMTSSVTCGENPKWRDDIKHNRLATTTLSGSKKNYSIEPGSWSTIHLNPGPLGSGALIGSNVVCDNVRDDDLVDPGSPSGVNGVLAENQAKTRFLSNLQDQTSAFQGGVFLGEISETIRMLRSPAKALREGLNSYYSTAKKRARRERGTKRKNRAVENTWLEYSFGWKPLINDVKDANKAFKRLAENPSVPVRLWAIGESASSSESVSSSTTVFNAITRAHTRVTQWSTVVFIGATVSRPMWSGSMKAELLGFHPRNFVPTIYNLIPYSFVLDYFTNVGDVIEGWANQRAGLAWSQRTVRHGVTRTRFYQITPTSSSYRLSGSGPVIERTNHTVNRAGYFGNFTPEVIFRIPGVDSTKWLNLAALFRLRR